MLKINEIKETTIQEVVCEEMDQLLLKRLTSDEMMLLMKIKMAFQKDENDVPEDAKSGVFKIMESRIKKHFSYTITGQALLFLSLHINTPGQAILYCWYLQYKCKKLLINEVTLDTLCLEIFKMGVFSQDSLQHIWVSQKIERPKDSGFEFSDNLLDHKNAGLSLFN
jgi:hypothetical protein